MRPRVKTNSDSPIADNSSGLSPRSIPRIARNPRTIVFAGLCDRKRHPRRYTIITVGDPIRTANANRHRELVHGAPPISLVPSFPPSRRCIFLVPPRPSPVTASHPRSVLPLARRNCCRKLCTGAVLRQPAGCITKCAAPPRVRHVDRRFHVRACT